MIDPAKAAPAKRLALLYDGTWNEPEDNTNVWRFKLMLSESGEDGVKQRAFYDEGVGTHWYDRLTGGAFGAGLSANIRQGYRWLMENYDHGDEVFVFGFSRGAYTARSLVGMIARCGLLKPDAPMSFAELFERYQKGDKVRPIYHLRYLQRHGSQDFDAEEKILLRSSWYERNLVKMVGVWDTVGSLGIPFGNIKSISRRTLRFHNTHLSKIVEHSYQALALDEYRKPYWAVLWTHFSPDTPDMNNGESRGEEQFVEQRWFSGAHADVGGGYRSDLMPQRPLAWLQAKAKACGLAFRDQVIPNEQDLKEDLSYLPRDSYREFLGGLWRILTLGHRYVRWVQSDPVKRKGGTVRTVNERIDLSVFQRCWIHNEYRPLSLREWARRKHLDLEEIIQNPKAYEQFWRPVTGPGIEGK